jgi:hypothetical protein
MELKPKDRPLISYSQRIEICIIDPHKIIIRNLYAFLGLIISTNLRPFLKC